eukprot:5290725-Pleurochrysis_carterae.AAC.1
MEASVSSEQLLSRRRCRLRPEPVRISERSSSETRQMPARERCSRLHKPRNGSRSAGRMCARSSSRSCVRFGQLWATEAMALPVNCEFPLSCSARMLSPRASRSEQRA